MFSFFSRLHLLCQASIFTKLLLKYWLSVSQQGFFVSWFSVSSWSLIKFVISMSVGCYLFLSILFSVMFFSWSYKKCHLRVCTLNLFYLFFFCHLNYVVQFFFISVTRNVGFLCLYMVFCQLNLCFSLWSLKICDFCVCMLYLFCRFNSFLVRSL